MPPSRRRPRNPKAYETYLASVRALDALIASGSPQEIERARRAADEAARAAGRPS